jgi:hypothetical protein
MHQAFRNGFEKTSASLSWGKNIPPPKPAPTFRSTVSVSKTGRTGKPSGPEVSPGKISYGNVFQSHEGRTHANFAARSQS